ncbi:hypothetical protein bAD24_p01075 (plasmid) [Burkholderia sp. AD24]|nr:hypothetical protein bAD24_p01075 [Burkholderia sp. AD24]
MLLGAQARQLGSHYLCPKLKKSAEPTDAVAIMKMGDIAVQLQVITRPAQTVGST